MGEHNQSSNKFDKILSFVVKTSLLLPEFHWAFISVFRILWAWWLRHAWHCLIRSRWYKKLPMYEISCWCKMIRCLNDLMTTITNFFFKLDWILETTLNFTTHNSTEVWLRTYICDAEVHGSNQCHKSTLDWDNLDSRLWSFTYIFCI